MLISHIAQSNYLDMLGYGDYYDLFVAIGRPAFPIYCFFVVQGVIYTRDIKKYLLRLLLFALISEIPFDLAFSKVLYFDKQNVMFTIFLGASCIALINILENTSYNKPIKIAGSIFLVLFFMKLAVIMDTDYSYKGVFAIFLLYLGRNNKPLTALAIYLGFKFEYNFYMSVYWSIPLLLLYNNKKGTLNKWLFYGFYPGHLLLIYFLMNYV